jgi:hypothetical protein
MWNDIFNTSMKTQIYTPISCILHNGAMKDREKRIYKDSTERDQFFKITQRDYVYESTFMSYMHYIIILSQNFIKIFQSEIISFSCDRLANNSLLFNSPKRRGRKTNKCALLGWVCVCYSCGDRSMTSESVISIWRTHHCPCDCCHLSHPLESDLSFSPFL